MANFAFGELIEYVHAYRTYVSRCRSKGMDFADEVPVCFLKGLGLAELLGAVGVILPAIVHVAVVLVPVAATCLALVMVGAIGVHIRRQEWPAILTPVVLLAAAVIVTWGRSGPYSL